MEDVFWFEMRDHLDGSVEVNVRRNGDYDGFTASEARVAANRLLHIVAEEARGSKLFCVIEFYDDSSTSISFGNGDVDEPRVKSLRDYIWMRRRFEEAVHGRFSRYTILPRWMIDVNSFFLFVLTRLMQVIDAVFDLDRNKWYERETEVRSEFPEEQGHEDLEELTGVNQKVIPLFRRKPAE